MKKLTIVLGGLLLVLGMGLSCNAMADTCNVLYIYYPAGHLHAAWCDHGDVVGISPGRLNTAGIGLYGPDCTVSLTRDVDKYSRSFYRVQQNYCVLEAGDITVQRTLGADDYKYTITPGSYGEGKGGKVRFKLK